MNDERSGVKELDVEESRAGRRWLMKLVAVKVVLLSALGLIVVWLLARI